MSFPLKNHTSHEEIFSLRRSNLRKWMNKEEVPSNFLFRSIQNEQLVFLNIQLCFQTDMKVKIVTEVHIRLKPRSAWPWLLSSSSQGPRCTQKFRRDYETSFALNLFALKLFVFIYAGRFLPHVCDRTDLYLLIGSSGCSTRLFRSWEHGFFLDWRLWEINELRRDK